MIWQSIKSEGYTPESRAAHSCEKIGKKLYIFGGWNGEIALNQIEVFDLTKKDWSLLETFGEGPSARNNHASCAYNNLLFIHGGHDGNQWLDDFFCLDTNNSCWKKIVFDNFSPSERACHTLSIVGHKIYLFGGYDGKKSFNDIEVFNIETMTWMTEENYDGTPPSTRNAHTATVVGECIYIFAGHYLNNHLNDLFFYNTKQRHWHKPIVGGDIPRGIRGHTATYYYNSIYIFGGFDGKNRSNQLYSFDLSNNQFNKIKLSLKEELLVRQRHTACLFNENEILFFGGFEGTTWLNNVDILNLNLLEEQMINHLIHEKVSSDYRNMLSDDDFHDVRFIVNKKSSDNEKNSVSLFSSDKQKILQNKIKSDVNPIVIFNTNTSSTSFIKKKHLVIPSEIINKESKQKSNNNPNSIIIGETPYFENITTSKKINSINHLDECNNSYSTSNKNPGEYSGGINGEKAISFSNDISVIKAHKCKF